jgi:hypothetical protein
MAKGDGLYSRYSTSKRNYLTSLWGQLMTDRSSFDAHWRDLGDYFMPRRIRFNATDRNKGDKRNQNIIDSTGRYAARTLMSGLHAGLTSPARPWFKLGTPDPDLAKFAPVKEWLHEVTMRMQTVFAGTNLYNSLPVLYGDMGVFATGAMSMVADEKDLFRTYVYPIGSYGLGMDKRGQVTTFGREYELTVRQVVEEFGGEFGQPATVGQPIRWDNISTGVRALYEAGTHEASVRILWMVTPNPEANSERLGAKYMPWASCHIEIGGESQASDDSEKILRESGFRNFPVMAPRWDITGEDAYGTSCPGMDTLGDNRQLQMMQKEKGKAIKKMIDPPLSGPSSLKTQKTSLIAGDITYVDVREGMQGLRAIHEVSLNLEHLNGDMAQVQYRIQRGFYEDLFLMLAQADRFQGADRPTAREVEERHEEKLIALGPVLERTNDELLNPLIDRAYQLMDDAGLIPEPPEELQGVKLKVEYISIMAQAQKLVGVAGQDRFLSTALPLVEFFPEVRHKIDVNQFIDNYADQLGVDPRAIRPTEEAEERATGEARAAQAQVATETALKGAQAAKLASETPINQPDTALTRMVEAGVV